MKISHIVLLAVILILWVGVLFAAQNCTLTCSTIGNITTCDQICVDTDKIGNEGE